MLASIRIRIAAALIAMLAVTWVGLAALPIVIALSFAVLMAATLTFLLSTSIVKPISSASEAARLIAMGNLHERVTPRPSGELGDLADAFNDMARSFDELLAAASANHSRMLAALNSSADAVIALDEHDAIAFANVAAGHLLSHPGQDMVGKPLAWIMPDAQVVEALRSSRERAQPEILVAERPNRRFLQVFVTSITDGGEWTSLLVLHDVSDVRRAEQVRRDFVANVSHELRTPLAALKSVIDTLREGPIEDRETADGFLARADGELARLVVMVEELLQLSRIESGELALAFQELRIDGVIKTAVERLRPEADRQGLTITVNIASSTPPLRADRDLLERALVNLIHNSVKFTPHGGTIEVSARTQDGVVTVEVCDTGEGIDPADLPRVFERFYKADRARRAGGTGLGLAIVKHTAEAHGGTVKAESEPGRGSTFSLTIPIHPTG
jgi:two-component system, OmpR family, phosphate regulon sensor histidine kinase PhoR